MQQPIHVELLLHAGADPSFADRNGNTPAHLAILNNSLEALRSLIKYLRPGVTATNPFPELDYLNFDGEIVCVCARTHIYTFAWVLYT